MYPGNKIVAVAWLETLGLTAAVGQDLPADQRTWSDHGFVLVASSVGGSPGRHSPMRNPVQQIECWTNQPDSEHAPWNQANELAEQIIAATFRPGQNGLPGVPQVRLPLPTGYRPVLLRSVYALTEPNELPGDEAGFARVQIDVGLHWTEAS